MIGTIVALAICAAIFCLYELGLRADKRALVAKEQVRQLLSTETPKPGLIKDVDYVLEKVPADGSKTVKLAIRLTEAGHDKLADHAADLLRARVNIALEAMKREGR